MRNGKAGKIPFDISLPAEEMAGADEATRTYRHKTTMPPTVTQSKEKRLEKYLHL